MYYTQHAKSKLASTKEQEKKSTKEFPIHILAVPDAPQV